MSRQLSRSVIATVISFGLLYYSVAWAVLKCSHDEEHSRQQIVLHSDDAANLYFHSTSADPTRLNLECVCPDYHTEVIAGSSSASQLQRLTPDLTPHINGLLISQAAAGYWGNDTSLRAVFESLSSAVFAVALPRYLFLSTLRI